MVEQLKRLKNKTYIFWERERDGYCFFYVKVKKNQIFSITPEGIYSSLKEFLEKRKFKYKKIKDNYLLNNKKYELIENSITYVDLRTDEKDYLVYHNTGYLINKTLLENSKHLENSKIKKTDKYKYTTTLKLDSYYSVTRIDCIKKLRNNFQKITYYIPLFIKIIERGKYYYFKAKRKNDKIFFYIKNKPIFFINYDYKGLTINSLYNNDKTINVINKAIMDIMYDIHNLKPLNFQWRYRHTFDYGTDEHVLDVIDFLFENGYKYKIPFNKLINFEKQKKIIKSIDKKYIPINIISESKLKYDSHFNEMRSLCLEFDDNLLNILKQVKLQYLRDIAIKNNFKNNKERFKGIGMYFSKYFDIELFFRKLEKKFKLEFGNELYLIEKRVVNDFNKFIFSEKKNGKFQIVNIQDYYESEYNYNTPVDVSYMIKKNARKHGYSEDKFFNIVKKFVEEKN